jgi:Rieske Fe-S protein
VFASQRIRPDPTPQKTTKKNKHSPPTTSTLKVVQHGLRRKALYRDPDGGGGAGGSSVRRLSAMCTHLGCSVEWNAAAHSFDCPCRGSEYDAHGRCVNGPAVLDLEDLGG